VTTFIDNVMVRIKTEERYNEIVEKILKRMVKNDLFVEPENVSGRLEKLC